MRKNSKGILIVLGVTLISFVALISMSRVKTLANNIPILKEMEEKFDLKKLIFERNAEERAPIDSVLTLKVIEELKDDINLDRTDEKNTNATIWYTMDKLFTNEYLDFVENDSIMTKLLVDRKLFHYDPEYVDTVQAKVQEWLDERNHGVVLNTRPFRDIEQRVWNGQYYVFFYEDQTHVDDTLISDYYVEKEEEEIIEEEPTPNHTSYKIPDKENAPQPVNLSTRNNSIKHPSIVNEVSTKVVERFNETRDQLAFAISVKAPNLSHIVDAVIENYETYGLSPYFQLAVFSLESAYGTSKLAREKNNIAGLNAYATATKSVYQNAFSFNSKADCTLRFGKIMGSNTYLGRGLYTLEQIASVYCPPEANSWSRQVSALINEYKSLAKSA